MAKPKTIYACIKCGAQSPQWLGQCYECGAWGSMEEEAPPNAARVHSTGVKAEVQPIASVGATDAPRTPTGIPGFDRILGGGLVQGSLILLGGEPGIGKSTLLTAAAGAVAANGGKALYLSGEESPRQVRLRAERIAALGDGFLVAGTTSLEECIAAIVDEEPDYIVVDSIQTLASAAIDTAPGSISQVRGCSTMLQAAVKRSGAALVLVGHVTKEGSIAGPKVLEHLVDTVVMFEGDGIGSLRTLRAVKNRFGSVNEIAVFSMGEQGLAEVENPSGALLAERQADAPGSAVFPAIEGTRALLVEVQALVAPNYTNNPRRTISGLDFNRAMLVLGVLEKRCGFRMGSYDVFVNVVGGIQIREPGADLALLLALVSSLRDEPIPADLVAFGEIGLTGEIRSVGEPERRLAEAARMGFARAAVSKHTKASAKTAIKAGGLRDVKDALNLLGV